MQSSAEADRSGQAGEMPHLPLSGWPTLPYDCPWSRWRFLVNFISWCAKQYEVLTASKLSSCCVPWENIFLQLASYSQLMYRFLEIYTIFENMHAKLITNKDLEKEVKIGMYFNIWSVPLFVHSHLIAFGTIYLLLSNTGYFIKKRM